MSSRHDEHDAEAEATPTADAVQGAEGANTAQNVKERTAPRQEAQQEAQQEAHAGEAPRRRRHAPAARKTAAPPMYERSPRLWTDTYWEPEDVVREATLTLPVEGYLTWLASHRMARTVGLQPSAYDNPLSMYLDLVLGMQPRLQTDGHRAWFMLRLTKTMRDADARHLRLVLPAWTTPLALEYTAFRAAQTSGHPMQRDVSAGEAYELVRHHTARGGKQRTEMEPNETNETNET